MRALTRLRLQFEEDSVLQYCLDLGLLRKERTFSCIMTLKSYSRSIDGFVHRCAIWSKRVSIREGKLIILIFRRKFLSKVTPPVIRTHTNSIEGFWGG